MCHQIVTDALRIHGGYGYSAEYTVERLYRDAPFLLIGEGTSEIQKLVIAPPAARAATGSDERRRKVAGPFAVRVPYGG